MPTPAWLAATAANPTKAGQVNQFLGAHAAALVYAGVVQSSQVTAGSGSVASNGLYIAESFTTGATQTSIGRIAITLAKTLAPPPFTVSIQATVTGSPSGIPLVSTVVPPDYVPGAAASLTIPLPVTGLTASTTYWIVINAVGTASAFFSWSKSNQSSGAKTSTNGTTWTTQTYGLLYQVADGTPAGELTHTWEDAGARWTDMSYSGQSLLTTLTEYTAGQTATGYLYSTRALSYASGQLTSIA